MIHRRVLPVVIALATCVWRVGAADPRAEFDRAVAALDELRYPEAVQRLDRAWRGGGNRPAELRRIFALAGTAAGSMGDGAAARIWFGRWLCIEPSAQLPAGSSPKLVALLEAARRELAGHSLVAHAARAGGAIAVTVDDDPLALVVAVRIGEQQQPIAHGAALLALPASSTTTGSSAAATSGPIELVDRYGNVLVELALPAPAVAARVPPVAETRAPVGALPAPEAAPERSWYARWPVWAGAAVGSAIIGGVALRSASNADARLDQLAQDSEQHEYTEARAEEDALSRAQWTARIAFGAAIASTALAVVCYLRGREVHTVVTPSPGGAAVTWSMRY